MKKVVILTESQLKNVVNNIVNEQTISNVGNIISKRDRKLNKKYIDAFNVLYTQMFRNYIPNPETVDLVEFKKSSNQSYFAIRSYRQNDLSSFVDMFSNGRYKMFSNNTLSSSGVMGFMNDEIQFRDDRTDEVIGNLSDVNNGIFTTTKKDKKNKSNQDSNTNQISPNKDKSTKNPITKKTTLPQAKTMDDLKAGKGFVYSGMKGNLVSEIQQMLKDLTYPVEVTGTFDTATYNAVKEYQKLAELKKVDGVVGSETYSSLVEYHKIKLRASAKLPDTTSVVGADTLKATDVTLPGKVSAPTSPEVNKKGQIDAGNQVYFKNVGFYRDPNNESRYVQVPGKNIYYSNDNTLRWVGQPPSKEDLDNLNAYLNSIGFTYDKEKSKDARGKKGNVKYIWKRK